MTIERDMKDWCDGFKASREWLTGVQADKSGSKHTQVSYRHSLKVFCEWIGKNPDQLIAERRTQLKNQETEMDMENKVRQFCIWLENSKKISRTTIATRYHGPLRSFFKYSNIPLKLTTFKHVPKERPPHTIEEIKALLEIADVREKAIIMLLKDSGISREDAVKLKYSDIQTDMEANKETVHIKLVRTKEMVSYNTFIGKNAIDALKVYLEQRKRRSEEITKDTYLIAQLNGEPTTPENLSQMFMRLGKKTGFHTSPHRLRKFFMSRLGLVVPSLLVRSWLGHSLGVESSYFLPDIEKQRTEYSKAYSQIDMSETKAIEEIEKIKAEKKTTNGMIGLQDRRIRELEAELKKLRDDFMSFPRDTGGQLMEKVKRGEMDHKSEDCQKVINEEQLQDCLSKGWYFVATLPSGKIVVTNE
jgi:integrase